MASSRFGELLSYSLWQETINSVAKWSPQSDIYSLGLVFYEIITLKIPFQNLDDVQALKAIEKNKLEDLPTYIPSVLKILIESMRSSKYKSRPLASQVLAKLQEFEALPEFQDLLIPQGIVVLNWFESLELKSALLKEFPFQEITKNSKLIVKLAEDANGFVRIFPFIQEIYSKEVKNSKDEVLKILQLLHQSNIQVSDFLLGLWKIIPLHKHIVKMQKQFEVFKAKQISKVDKVTLMQWCLTFQEAPYISV